MARQVLRLRRPSCHWPAGEPRVAAQAGGAAAAEAAAASSRYQAMLQRSAGRPLPTAPHPQREQRVPRGVRGAQPDQGRDEGDNA
jgi:hypothetical protein